MVFGRAGGDGALYDSVPGQARRAKAWVEAGLADLAADGLGDDPDGAAARVRVAADLADAVARADFVQENLPETVEAQPAIFPELDRLAPDSLLPPPSHP